MIITELLTHSLSLYSVCCSLFTHDTQLIASVYQFHLGQKICEALHIPLFFAKLQDGSKRKHMDGIIIFAISTAYNNKGF